MPSNIPQGITSYLDDVARHLRDLNAGEPISVAWARYPVWTRYLLRACRRKPRGGLEPKPRGRPLNLTLLEMVAYENVRRVLEQTTVVAKTSPYSGDPDKARSILPEEEKRRLSKKYGCSVRTIASMQRIVDAVIPEHPEEPEEPARSPSDEERIAVLKGICRAMGESGKRKDAEELRRRKERGS
jgi:hypothetical protein